MKTKAYREATKSFISLSLSLSGSSALEAEPWGRLIKRGAAAEENVCLYDLRHDQRPQTRENIRVISRHRTCCATTNVSRQAGADN